MEFSVLATSFNDENNIENFLNNFEKQSVKPTFVVIVDGGSKDNTKKKINEIREKYSFTIMDFFNIGRLNISQGYNEAVRRCPTQEFIIAGIGNDYSNNFCQALLTYYESNDVHVVYTPIVGVEKTKFSVAFNEAFVGGKKGKTYSGASNRGAFMSKAVFEKIGYFYEEFVYAGEDAEYFDRVRNHGLSMQCTSDAKVYWETPCNFKEYLKKMKVNAIADMQLLNKSKIAKHVLSRIFLLFVGVAALIFDWRLFVAYILTLYLMLAVKMKTVNVKAVLLRLHFLFLPTYYYLTQKKYMKKEYHFDARKIPTE